MEGMAPVHSNQIPIRREFQMGVVVVMVEMSTSELTLALPVSMI
jgi:hypothetical protein